MKYEWARFDGHCMIDSAGETSAFEAQQTVPPAMEEMESVSKFCINIAVTTTMLLFEYHNISLYRAAKGLYHHWGSRIFFPRRRLPV